MENSFEIWNEWEGITLYCEDNIKVLATLADNSVDAVITDPPAGISFMNKKWDANKGGRSKWIAWLASVLRECYRVMKPGGSLLVWALPRTSHWTGMAIEDAGFRPVDIITHLFGTGFPKSLAIGKALDKAAGAEREVVGISPNDRPNSQVASGRAFDRALDMGQDHKTLNITIPTTEAAKLFDGYGTALKPAAEFWWLAFKPREGTYANNALKHGVAGLWIDGGRVPTTGENLQRPERRGLGITGGWATYSQKPGMYGTPQGQGRWPANLILSHSPGCTQEQDAWDCEEGCAVRLLGEQSGERECNYRATQSIAQSESIFGKRTQGEKSYNDTGTASRFFLNLPPDACRFKYQAKASRRERNEGLEGMPTRARPITCGHGRGPINTSKKSDGGIRENKPTANTHPCVKPLGLMKYLCTLVKPPTGGVLLDPFMGSGSTGVAAVELVEQEWDFIGIDNNQNSFDIAKARINQACEDLWEGEK